MIDRAALPPEEIARQSVERFHAKAKKKYLDGQAEHGGDLVQKVRLEHLEEEIIDLLALCVRLEVEVKRLACRKNRPYIKGCKHD